MSKARDTDVKDITPKFNDAADGKAPPKTPEHQLHYKPPVRVPTGPGLGGGSGTVAVNTNTAAREPENATVHQPPAKAVEAVPSKTPLSPKEQVLLRRAFRKAHDNDLGNGR